MVYIYISYIHISPCAVNFTVFPSSCSDVSPGNAACTSLADLQSWSWQEIWSLPDPQLAIRSRSVAWDPLKLVKLGQHHWEDLSRASQLIPVDKSCIVLLLFPLPFLILEVGNLNKNTGKTMELELFDPFFSSFLLLWSF